MLSETLPSTNAVTTLATINSMSVKPRREAARRETWTSRPSSLLWVCRLIGIPPGHSVNRFLGGARLVGVAAAFGDQRLNLNLFLSACPPDRGRHAEWKVDAAILDRHVILELLKRRVERSGRVVQLWIVDRAFDQHHVQHFVGKPRGHHAFFA